MLEFLYTPTAKVVLLFAAMCGLFAIGYYVIQRFRPNEKDDLPSVGDHISHFRELRSQGKLTEEEYRTIKTKLASQFQEELNSRGNES
jgi:uncharacterized membrane protein